MPDKLSIPDDPLTQEDARSIVENDPEFARLVAMELRKKQRRKPKAEPSEDGDEHKTTHKFAPMVPPQITYHPKLNATQKLVYVAMLTQSKGRALCMASQIALAKDLRLSVRTIRDSIAALETHRCLRTNKDAYGSQDSYTMLIRVKQKTEGMRQDPAA